MWRRVDTPTADLTIKKIKYLLDVLHQKDRPETVLFISPVNETNSILLFM